MHPFIPEDIVITILTQLPPDSLARFKCVSKQWRRLISETLNNTGRKVFTMSWHEDGCYFQSINQETLEVEDVDIPWKDEVQRLMFYESCNGLLLVESSDDLFLWNPFIRYHQKILSYQDLSCHFSSGGLCFDSEKKEYKVVLCLRYMFARDEFVVVGSPRDKSWKHVDFPYGWVNSGPLLNNRLHWFVGKKDSCLLKQSLIIYFDAKVDGFVELPLPLMDEDKTLCISGLGVLDGCLCISCEEGSLFDKRVKVMAMKEYGVRESWTTLFKLEGTGYYWSFAVPLFYLDAKKTEVLISLIDRCHGYDLIIAYDTNSNSESEVVTIVDVLRGVIVYEETSVKPIGYDWEELDSRGEASYVEIFDSNCRRTMKKDKNGHWYDPDESDDECKEATDDEGKKMTEKVS